MKPQRNKLKQQEQEQTVHQEQTLQQQEALEFASAEEVLQFDAAHTEVPARVGQRLEKSLADTPPPSGSWWKRLLRKHT